MGRSKANGSCWSNSNLLRPGCRVSVYKAGIFRGELGQGGPIAIAMTLCDGGEEMIVNLARQRQRHGKCLGGRQRQAVVLEAQRHLEAGGLELLVGDDPAIGLVDRRSEQTAGQDVEELVRIDA